MTVDLRERLRRALGTSRPALDAGQVERSSEADGGQRGWPGLTRERDIQDLVAGTIVDGPFGGCFVAERVFNLDHLHGSESLGAFFKVSDRGLGCLARSADPLGLDRESILF